MPGKGKPFEKGVPRHPKAGRIAGTPNRTTVEVKELLESCCKEIGGLERLVKWVNSDPHHETIFWSSMYMRLLPVQVQGTGQGGSLVLTIKHEELEHRLEERGLPLDVFGRKIPLLELKAEKPNGKQR